jgi:hypothetical protein
MFNVLKSFVNIHLTLNLKIKTYQIINIPKMTHCGLSISMWTASSSSSSEIIRDFGLNKKNHNVIQKKK